jgi:hypothetical protein
MITFFVPSYNRPCQLHALLESFLWADQRGEFASRIHVYYAATTLGGWRAYEDILINTPEFYNIHFHPKSESHYKDMMDAMTLPKTPLFGFLTDDSIFYRQIDTNESPESFIDFFDKWEPNHFTFRCGRNTQVVDYANPDYKEIVDAKGYYATYLRWKWKEHKNHYGFPCSIDSSIWDREYIQNVVEKACSHGEDFNFRHFECKVHEWMLQNSTKPYAMSFENSVLVNIPCNQVVENFYLKNGVQHCYAVDELNTRYLNGEKIDIAAIRKHEIVSVQQEFPLEFIKR